MRKALFASRSLGVAALAALLLPGSVALAQANDAIDQISVTGLTGDEYHESTLPTDDDRTITVNIENCRVLAEDLTDDIDVVWTFANPDSDLDYVIKLSEPSEACSRSELTVDDPEDEDCDILETQTAITEDVRAEFTVGELLGDGFSGPDDCYDSSLDGTYAVHLVFEVSSSSDTTTGEDDTLNFVVELDRPTAPSGVSVTAGESSADVSWDEVSAADSYEVYVVTSISDFEVDQPEDLTASARDAGGTSKTVTGLDVDTTYYVAVLSVDENGNRSVLSEATEFTTVPSDDFWELYRDQGGVEEGGCSAVGTRGAAPLLFALIGLVLVRRRRSRGVAAALLVAAGTLSAAPAHADIEFRDDSRITGAFELKLGRYTPEIDSDFDGTGPYELVFGDRSPLLIEAEYDRQFWRGVGSLGVFGAVGLNQVKGASISEDGTDAADETRLRIVPFRVGLVYRFDYLQERWNVPLVIALKGGLDYYAWFVRTEGGIADHTDALGNRTVGRGGTTGYHLAVGGYFLLDFLAPRMAANFDTNSGVNNTYLFAELMMARVDDFGGDGSWDLSDTSVLFGIAFEF